MIGSKDCGKGCSWCDGDCQSFQVPIAKDAMVRVIIPEDKPFLTKEQMEEVRFQQQWREEHPINNYPLTLEETLPPQDELGRLVSDFQANHLYPFQRAEKEFFYQLEKLLKK